MVEYRCNTCRQITQYDLAEQEKEKAAVASIVKAGANFVGTVSQQMQWEDGSPQKMALHGLVGFIAAKEGGGDLLAGAASAAGSELLNTYVAEYLGKNTNLSQEQRNAIQSLTATGVGMLIGNAIGGDSQSTTMGMNIARLAEENNRQLHPNEMKWIKENAEQFAREQGIDKETAEKRLAQQAEKDLDILWFLKLNDEVDSSARAFLATQNKKTFTDSQGNVQNYFVAKGNDFFESRKYAKESYNHDQQTGDKFFERNLQSGIVRTAKEGLIDKTQNLANAAMDSPLETGKAVASNLWEGAKDCATAPIDCVSDFASNLWSTGKSTATETYHNVRGTDQAEINAIYGGDVSNEMLAASGVQLAGTVAEVVGAGKVVKVGMRAGVQVVGEQINKGINKHTLKDILSSDNVTVPTSSGYINAEKLNQVGVTLKATNQLERDLLESIKSSGDPSGSKTETLINSLAARSGYKVLEGGKYGGNKGFDHVLMGKDGSIIIIDSKPLSSRGTLQLNTKGARDAMGNTTNQLSPRWIEAVANKLASNDPVKAALESNNKEIKTLITTVDKKTGEIKLVPVKVNNK